MPKHAILAQCLDATLRRTQALLSVRQWAGVVVLGLCGVAAFGLAPDTTLETVPTRVVTRTLPLPSLAAEAPAPEERFWREERIQRGDTVGSVLARVGVDDPSAMAFLRTDPAARPLYQLRPGKPLRVETDDAGRLLQLRFATGGGDLLTIAREGDDWVASTQPAPVDVQWRMASGEIRSSLFGAADAAGVPDAVTLQLADVFAGDIDFFKDLKRGDRFTVVYEVRHLDGEVQGAGRIVAAEFVNGGKRFRAFLWRGEDGSDSYYADDGSPLRKAFLRSPMEFSRITSGFSNARFHPILQVTRAHRGTDYAAPVGTPIRATGSGKVLVAGRQGGYGNVIHVQHAGGFSTVYAHLSRFAPQVKTGARVSQGEVIGHVGQTGWATGPHLHYEFRVGGEARDPQTIALPSGAPLPATERVAFAAGIAPAAAQILLAQSLSGLRIATGP
ncbi:MAG: peptidoglycan DD-metalloendopeptidase family protein [Betaproteobacteria bacterium]|nr:peptidoglycan DD-metalloendopeptidase family protein [Betaproteobacteria bacterium]